jgi:hypothetical protein
MGNQWDQEDETARDIDRFAVFFHCQRRGQRPGDRELCFVVHMFPWRCFYPHGTLAFINACALHQTNFNRYTQVEELLNYGALPPVAPQARRSTVIRLNLSRPTKRTIVPAFTSGTRLAARPFDSFGGINMDSATCSSDVMEAAETLVMEVLGYCDQPEGWEDHVIDEHLGPEVAAAAVKVCENI